MIFFDIFNESTKKISLKEKLEEVYKQMLYKNYY